MAERIQPMTLSETLQSREMRRQRTPSTSDWHWSEWLTWPGRLTLLTILLAAPWMFGAVYSFSQTYLAIGLMIAAAFWYLESAFSLRASQVIPYVIWLVLLGVLLALVQVQTVFPQATQWLAGQQLNQWNQVFGEEALAEQALIPTIAVDPEANWRYTRLLIMAVAGVLLGARLFRRPLDVMVLLVALTANGVALAFFGMIQRMSHNGKMFWVFESDYGGVLFGPFVNRNNAAGFLLICLAAAVGLIVKLWSHRVNRGPDLLVSKEIPIWRQIATYWQIALSELTASKLAAVIAAVFIATGVIATLSRGGVLGLLAASIVTLLVFGMARKPRSGGLLLLPLVALVVMLASWVGFYEQMMGRFAQFDTSDEISTWDGRIISWQTTLPHALDYGALGAGLGSYPTVHRSFADYKEEHWLEYAENQFVQTYVEAGIPGLVLLCLAVIAFLSLATFMLYRGSSPTNLGLGTTGVFLISGQVATGLFDFGWYIPANMLTFAVLVGVVSFHGQSLAGRLKKKSWWRHETSGWLVKPCGLMLIAALVYLVVDYRGETLVDQTMRKLPGNKAREQLSRESCSLEQTQSAIEELTAVSRTRFDSRLANRLGDLWVHRARWEMYQQLLSSLPVESLQDKAAAAVTENLWALTSPIRLQEQVGFLKNTAGQSGVSEFRQQPSVRNNLPLAAEYYAASLRSRPVQAETQLKLGNLALILAQNSRGLEQIESAVQLAPGNTNMRYMAALANVFADRYEHAFVHLRKLLELEPRQFVRTIRLLQGLSGRVTKPVDNRLIADEIIPNDPEMIYDFLSQYLSDQDDALRSELLDQAIALVSQRQTGLIENRLLLAKLFEAKGNLEKAIESWEWVLIASPDNHKTRMTLVENLIQLERFQDAEPHARRLLSTDTKNKTYIQLIKKVDLGLEKQRQLEIKDMQKNRTLPVDGDSDSSGELSKEPPLDRANGTSGEKGDSSLVIDLRAKIIAGEERKNGLESEQSGMGSRTWVHHF